MKKKIVILGSTGSIGKNTIKIINKNKNKFKILLLSTNTNVKKIINQARELDVQNIIISNYKKYSEAKIKHRNKKIKISYDFILIFFFF